MIDPKKLYTLTEVEKLGREGFFPVKDRHTIKKMIDNGKILAINSSAGLKTRWHIQGAELLAYLKKAAYAPKRGKKKEKDAKSLQETQREVQS